MLLCCYLPYFWHTHISELVWQKYTKFNVQNNYHTKASLFNFGICASKRSAGIQFLFYFSLIKRISPNVISKVTIVKDWLSKHSVLSRKKCGYFPRKLKQNYEFWKFPKTENIENEIVTYIMFSLRHIFRYTLYMYNDRTLQFNTYLNNLWLSIENTKTVFHDKIQKYWH